ncbi:hypothetical protein COCSADRAFT_161984 [Bipolaris sorokiniana ND90Pr]|uniref:Uncharacterized protein n=1 Tax=Cochliobolus sativus (strain ND90Pr / ATCC 201652) TaxID=665912 RepID=M2SZL5_COCSN|nr:uncharacterized protein COCSADRAFT_161984 [Bipolaris sorokiniana ND90Pr]EMD62391.1 hypothetical protein COCSADRAFT_161984 [Bipolaris sorokiniana ND90Pr]
MLIQISKRKTGLGSQPPNSLCAISVPPASPTPKPCQPNSRVSMQNSPPNSPLYAKKTNKNNNNNNSSINKIEINKFNRMYTNTHATNNNNPYTIVSATTTISTANPKPKLPTSAPSKNATATSPSGPQTTSLFTAHYSADRD